MALNLKLPTIYNVECSYWRVVQTNIDWANRISSVVMFGYLDKDSRQLNKFPLVTKKFSWDRDEFPFDIAELNKVNNNSIKIAYKKIKDLEEFKTSTDV